MRGCRLTAYITYLRLIQQELPPCLIKILPLLSMFFVLLSNVLMESRNVWEFIVLWQFGRERCTVDINKHLPTFVTAIFPFKPLLWTNMIGRTPPQLIWSRKIYTIVTASVVQFFTWAPLRLCLLFVSFVVTSYAECVVAYSVMLIGSSTRVH